MSNPTTIPSKTEFYTPHVRVEDLPLLYEDDEEGDMGESNSHSDGGDILRFCLKIHFKDQPQYRIFLNMNLYYHPKDRRAYVSPDVMVVEPNEGREVETSYRIGEDGPAPLLTTELLSERSAQQRDLEEKVLVYAVLKVAEYVLVDPSGRFLTQKLLLKRLQPNGTWLDMQDPDGGVTSQLGFRLMIEADGRLRVFDASTGKPYLRPDEAASFVYLAEDRLDEAQLRIQELEAEVARLRQSLQKSKNGS